MTNLETLISLMNAMNNDDFDYRVDNGEYTIFLYSIDWDWEKMEAIYNDAEAVDSFLNYLDKVATYADDSFNCPAEVEGTKIYIVFED